MKKNYNRQESIATANTFFEIVLPEMLYDDRFTDEVVFGIFDVGENQVHRLLKLYCECKNVECPYEVSAFKILGNKEGDVISFRCELPHESGVTRFYIFFELTDMWEVEALIYLYITQDARGKKAFLVDPEDFNHYSQSYMNEADDEVVANLYYENIALMVV